MVWQKAGAKWLLRMKVAKVYNTCKTNESLLKIYRIKIRLNKICYMYMIPVLSWKVSTDFINDSFSFVFSRNSSPSSIINKV